MKRILAPGGRAGEKAEGEEAIAVIHIQDNGALKKKKGSDSSDAEKRTKSRYTEEAGTTDIDG